MLTLAQAARKKEQAGLRLPNVWHGFDRSDIFLRRGQLHLLVAAPGVGKSVLSQVFALRSGTKCLYLSLDTDAFTTSIRAVMSLTNITQDRAEAGVHGSEGWAVETLEGIKNLKYSFPSSPTVEEIFYHIHAYAEAMGDWPELIVIDNLANVAFEGEEWGEMRTIMADLQTMAIRTRSAVLVLHHAVGAFEDGLTTIPQSGVAGKLAKFPSMVLTMCRDGDYLVTSVVKNRFGPSDPSGQEIAVKLRVDMSRMQINDPFVIEDRRGNGIDRVGRSDGQRGDSGGTTIGEHAPPQEEMFTPFYRYPGADR